MNGGMPNSAGTAGSGKRTEKRRRVGKRIIRTAAALAVCASFLIAEAGEPVWPKPPQEAEMRDGSLEADVSGMDDGYVVVRFGSPKGRVKIGVSYEGEDEVYFDADSDSEFEVIPLNEGAGGYRLSLYESEIGTLYERMGTVFVNERTDASEKAFLAPNAQVRYGRISPPALFAAKTLSGKPDEEVLRETKALMASRFCYDYAKAAGMPKTGVLPDVRGCFESGQGTCGDLAATGLHRRRMEALRPDSGHHGGGSGDVRGGKDVLNPPAAETDSRARHILKSKELVDCRSKTRKRKEEPI